MVGVDEECGRVDVVAGGERLGRPDELSIRTPQVSDFWREAGEQAAEVPSSTYSTSFLGRFGSFWYSCRLSCHLVAERVEGVDGVLDAESLHDEGGHDADAGAAQVTEVLGEVASQSSRLLAARAADNDGVPSRS